MAEHNRTGAVKRGLLGGATTRGTFTTTQRPVRGKKGSFLKFSLNFTALSPTKVWVRLRVARKDLIMPILRRPAR